MVLETLKLHKMTKSARVGELRTMPLEKIMAVPPPEVMYQPCADGVLWKEVPYWDKLADPTWMVDKPDFVDAVMFSDCKDDVRNPSFKPTLIARAQSNCYSLIRTKIHVQISPR